MKRNMLVVCGSLRCGLGSVQKLVRDLGAGERVRFIRYFMFEPERYTDELKDAHKILIILREPTARAFSLWKSNLQTGFEWLDFEKAIATEQIRFYKLRNSPERWRYLYFRGGLYSRMIERLVNVIGYDEFSRRAKVLTFEDALLKGRIIDEMRSMGLLKGKSVERLPHLNASRGPASPRFQFVVRRLAEIISEDVFGGNERAKGIIRKMAVLIMEANIRVQELSGLNREYNSKDTQGIIDFLKHAYAEELEVLAEKFPQTRIWLR